MPLKSRIPTISPSLYERDFYAWANCNADALREGHLREIDAEHIAEELEDMGRSEVHRLESHLTILIAHLLKWQVQPDRRGNSWRSTIKEQRRQVERIINKNPSLKAQRDETHREAYEDAILRASAETDLDESSFKAVERFDFDQALNPDFWPDV